MKSQKGLNMNNPGANYRVYPYNFVGGLNKKKAINTLYKI